MARIILGAMVTDIRGSIGGTTIRNVGGNFVMSNKSSGINRQNLFRNESLFFKRILFNMWQTFNNSEKKAWESASNDFPQVDKFGNSVILSPYNFYTKFIMQQSMIKFDLFNPLEFSNFILPAALDNFIINSGLGEVTCDVSTDGGPVGVLVQIYRIPNPSVKPIFNRRKFLLGGYFENGDTMDLKLPFIDRFGVFPDSGWFRMVYYFQNQYGERSTPQFIDTEVV